MKPPVDRSSHPIIVHVDFPSEIIHIHARKTKEDNKKPHVRPRFVDN